MIIRATDSNGDWTFGQGKSSYKNGLKALTQWVDEVLQIWLNDLFYATSNGIDWLNLLGGAIGDANETISFIRQDINIAITQQQKYGITGINSLDVNYNRFTRQINITYQLNTIYGNTPNIDLILEFYGNI